MHQIFDNREKIAKLLFGLCLVVWVVTWLYSIAFEEWGLIAGFFKGLAYGGTLAIIPFIVACYDGVQSKFKSPSLVNLLFISGIWIIAVGLLYWA